MSNFEEMKKYAKWRARKIGKWCLFGLCVVGVVLAFVGMAAVTAAAPPIDSLPWIAQIGIIVAMLGWIIGGAIIGILLAKWASED